METLSSSGGRNIWKTKRDKERMHARYEIRERIVVCQKEQQVEKSSPQLLLSNNSSGSGSDGGTGGAPIVRYYFSAIEKRDIAAFGIAKLVKNLSRPNNLLDCCHPVRNLNLQKAYYMCVSRFGVQFGTSTSNYMKYLEAHNLGISLISYAAMLGEYQIACSLLKGGADPTVAAITSSRSSRSATLRQKFHRMFFVDYFPPMLAVWIVRCVVVMRINGIKTTHASTEENVFCPICKDTISPPFSLLTWGEPCQHCFCESCCWEDVLHNMDDRDEIVCPICLSIRMDKPNENCATFSSDCKETECVQKKIFLQADSFLTSKERYQISLNKFNALPPTKVHITGSSGKNSVEDGNRLQSSADEDPFETKPKRFKRKNIVDTSWSSSLARYIGRSQESRRDAFFSFVARNAKPYVQGLLQAGVNVNDVNEYHQTNLYIASWYGYTSIVKLLLYYGADPNIQPNGSVISGSTTLSIARVNNHNDIVDMLMFALTSNTDSSVAEMGSFTCSYNDDALKANSCVVQSFDHDVNSFATHCERSRSIHKTTTIRDLNNLQINSEPLSKLTILISPSNKDHPGAGSFIIDNVLPEQTLQYIEKLWKSLPVEYGRKGIESATTCATRSYFCDAENILTSLIVNELMSHWQQGDIVVMPHMRFLHYAHPNISLPTHVDLSRIDRFGRHSTHSFLLYLFDCDRGGETILLQKHQITNKRQNGEHYLDTQEKAIDVRPKRGRLLVFPHLCPHKGGNVESVPKVLIRGEIYFGQKTK